jgi:nodulation protein E
MNRERTYLEHDWFSGGIPSNVTLGKNVYIDTAYGFASFFSEQQPGLTLGDASGAYDRTSFVVGAKGHITVGAYTVLNGTYLVCHNRITIGDHCLIAWGSVFTDSWLDARAPLDARREVLRRAAIDPMRRLAPVTMPRPITLEDNVWVGFDSVVLPGVRLGRGAVIGCKSVIAEDVSPYAVVVGNPGGLIAAREAIADAEVEWNESLHERTAIVTGSCLGGKIAEDQVFSGFYQNTGRAHPLSLPRAMANAGASHISMEFGIKGPTYTVSTACASANHAIGQAFHMVRHGAVEMAITGGSEAPFTLGHLKKWEAMRVVAPDTCRPFTKERRGMILGEGGAMIVLETLETARARGAKIYAEIVGFGMSSDAHHITQPTSEGPARAMHLALQDGAVNLERVGYINAHGTGTTANDATETIAIRAVFAEHADRLAVSSTKSMHGHALGAAGAIEAVATILALQNGVLPPTANFTTPDPECDLDVVPNEARRTEVEYALSNSFAFGGLNAVLAFRRWRD